MDYYDHDELRSVHQHLPIDQDPTRRTENRDDGGGLADEEDKGNDHDEVLHYLVIII